MTDLSPLIPGQPVPALTLPTVEHGTWRLADQAQRRFTLIAFYRGLHCPACAAWLQQLHTRLDVFEEKGVAVLAASCDDAERARAAHHKWRLGRLSVGHDLPLAEARHWGLFLSQGRGKTSIGVEEPALFSEPGLFLIRADGRLQFSAVQSMPFARPHFDEVLKAIDFITEKDYPPRGELVDLAGRQAAE